MKSSEFILQNSAEDPHFNSIIKAVLDRFTGHDSASEVGPKVLLIDSLMGTNLKNIQRELMVSRIVHLAKTADLKNRIDSCSKEAVNTIAEATGGLKNHFSFATKYCYWHNRKFIIYDNNVISSLRAANKLKKFTTESLENDAIRSYEPYFNAFQAFKSAYNLADFEDRQVELGLYWCYRSYFSKAPKQIKKDKKRKKEIRRYN